MSLDPRDSRRRDRSRSPGRRDDRERSTSRVRAPSPPSRYDDDRGYEYEEKATVVTAEPRDSRYAGASSKYRAESPPPRDPYASVASKYRMDSPPARDPYAMPGGFKEKEEEEVKVRYGDRREKEYYSETTYSRKDEYGRPTSPPERSRYEAESYKYSDPRDRERDRDPRRFEDERLSKKERDHERDVRRYEEERHSKEKEKVASFDLHAGHHSISGGINIGHESHDRPHVPGGYGQPPASTYGQPYPPGYGAPPESPPRHASYAEPKKWEYAQPNENITYTRRTESTSYARPASPSERTRHPSYGGDSARSSKSNVVTVEPGSRVRHQSITSLAPKMHSLSVSTGNHGGAALSLSAAPGSPLLESYHGTYQSISPMPSPLMIPATSHTHTDVNIESISPLNSDDERRGGKKGRRTARFHDPVDEAKLLAQALKGEKRAPDMEPLIEILPGLTHEQVLDLRVEYKKIVKTGSDKKGVNIAKHIKLRLKEEDPSLMKACYACALGQWESEAYWANFWYQGEKSRRELLIESLMGRTNREIREIKDGFNDKKYSDSLTKCMKTELKEDKFKKAVLLVLEEKKMEERSSYGIDMRLVEDDVHDLHKAVRSEKGGETAMINIIVVRSDGHLREILRLYESTYRTNFAREMLKKSGNLVGELLAHILNGVINKPVRDALLIHHALSLSKSDSIRTELLISRLVRYHWDRPHMEAVKKEYRLRYGIDMQKAVADGTKSDWGHFCEMLCVRRMGDEVREVRRVEEYRVDRL